MQIEAAKQVTNRRPDKAPPDESQQESLNQKDFINQNDAGDHDFAGEMEASHALVVTAPATASRPAAPYRQATFLAHLIATREHVPQTRERRRAEPSEAVAAYRTMAALTHA